VVVTPKDAVQSAAEQGDAWWLSDAERCRAASLPSRRAADFRAGRLAARLLAGVVLAGDNRRVEVSYLPQGPCTFVRSGEQIGHLSISHSHGHAIAAFADAPVGADVERSVKAHAAVARFLFGPTENPPGTTLAHWVVREAAIKAAGWSLGHTRSVVVAGDITSGGPLDVQCPDGVGWLNVQLPWAIVCLTRGPAD
jgi:phosphopantetheinyl transferase